MFHNFKLWLCSWFLTMKELLLSLMAKIYWKTSKMVTLWWLHTVKTFFFSSGARRSFVEALFLHHGKKLCLFLLVFSWIISTVLFEWNNFWIAQIPLSLTLQNPFSHYTFWVVYFTFLHIQENENAGTCSFLSFH